MAVRSLSRRPAVSSHRRKSPAPRTRRTPAQRRYDDVAALEKRLGKLMTDIPYMVLGADPLTRQDLDAVDTHLRNAVTALERVRGREAPRYERWAEEHGV